MHEKVCVVCFEEEEDLDHLLFKCKVSERVWVNIYSWLGMKNLGVYGALTHYTLFTQALQGKIKKKNLSLCCLATVWSIWNMWNILLNGKLCILDYLVMSVKGCLGSDMLLVTKVEVAP